MTSIVPYVISLIVHVIDQNEDPRLVERMCTNSVNCRWCPDNTSIEMCHGYTFNNELIQIAKMVVTCIIIIFISLQKLYNPGPDFILGSSYSPAILTYIAIFQ